MKNLVNNAISSLGVLVFIAMVCLGIVLFIGWFKNIVSIVLFVIDFNEAAVITNGFILKFIVQIVGVFYWPIGGIVGWFV